MPMHSSLTMNQAQAHYDTVMTEEEQPAPAPMSAFTQVPEEQRYNMFLLEQHWLAEGQIYGERASEEAVASMCTANPNFVAEQ